MKFQKLASLFLECAMVAGMSVGAFADIYPQINQEGELVVALAEINSLAEGDIIDLKDGLSAVVTSVDKETKARIVDTFTDTFNCTLDLYWGAHWMGTLTATGVFDYSPTGRWVAIHRADVSCSSGDAEVDRGTDVNDGDPSVETIIFRVTNAGTERTVVLSATSGGTVSFYES